MEHFKKYLAEKEDFRLNYEKHIKELEETKWDKNLEEPDGLVDIELEINKALQDLRPIKLIFKKEISRFLSNEIDRCHYSPFYIERLLPKEYNILSKVNKIENTILELVIKKLNKIGFFFELSAERICCCTYIHPNNDLKYAEIVRTISFNINIPFYILEQHLTKQIKFIPNEIKTQTQCIIQ
jgi:hypothetical protein